MARIGLHARHTDPFLTVVTSALARVRNRVSPCPDRQLRQLLNKNSN